MRLKWMAVFITGAIVIFLSCKKDSNFSSHISFVHGALGFPPITLKADSAVLLDNIINDTVVYNTQHPSGTYAISLSASGVAPLTLTTNLEAGASYIGFLYDTATSSKLYFTKDIDLPAAPEAGRCRVRFYNIMTGSPAYTLANDTFRYYATVPAFGTYANTFAEIDTLATPSIRKDSATYIARLPTFRSGKIYTIYLTGRLGDTLTGLYRPRAFVQVNN